MEKLYTSREVSEILEIQAQAVTYYYKKYGIGKKIGRDILFTEDDIMEIQNTDGRKKAED